MLPQHVDGPQPAPHLHRGPALPFAEQGHAAGQLGALAAVLGTAVGELPRAQGRDQRVRVGARLGQRQRPRRGLVRARDVARVVAGLGQPGEQPRFVAAGGVERAQAPALHGAVPGAVADGVEGERGRRDEIDPTGLLGQLHRIAAGREGGVEPARGHLDGALREQEIGLLGRVQRRAAVGQRRGVQPCGVLVREGAGGIGGGAPRPLDRGPALAGDRHRRPVPRDLGRHLRQPAAVQVRERLRGPDVQHDGLLQRRLGRQHRADQAVGEPEPPTPGVDQQTRGQRLARGGQAPGRRQLQQPRDDGELELLREQRRGPQQPLGGRVEPADPRHDDLGQALGHEPGARGDQAGELAEEQRVAAAGPRGLPDLRRREVAPHRGAQQVGDRRLVETAQRTAVDVRAAEQVGSDLVPPGTRRTAAPRRAADHPATGRVPQEQPQRQERRLVGPLDVVDDEQAAPVRHHDVAQRAEQREAVACPVGADLRDELAPHPERRCALFRALRPPHPGRRATGQRPHQGRLADARLTLDHDEPWGSERAGLGHVAQPRELVVAAEQRARHPAESIGERRGHREMHYGGVLRRRNPAHVHLDGCVMVCPVRMAPWSRSRTCARLP